MDEIIDQVAARTGLPADTVASAVGILVRFVAAAAPRERIAPVADKIPGLDAKIRATPSAGAANDLLGTFNDLAGLGLGLGEIQPLLQAFLEEMRNRAGADEIDALMASIPALRTFL